MIAKTSIPATVQNKLLPVLVFMLMSVAGVRGQSFRYPQGLHVQAGGYVGLPLLSTNGDYVFGTVPTPSPGIILEGSWEVNSDISIGYDFRKWSVTLRHRFHRYNPDSVFLRFAAQLENPRVFNHHDAGIIISRNLISRKARAHQIGIGFTVNNIGSSHRGFDARQPDIFPATIRNQYNSLSFQYARQLLKPLPERGSSWFNHFYLKFSTDYAPDIPLQSVVTVHRFFRFGLGLQYQFSSLWQPPVVPVRKVNPFNIAKNTKRMTSPLKLTAGLRFELPISAFSGGILYPPTPSDYDFEYNQFTMAPSVGVRYYLPDSRWAFTYLPGLKRTVLNYNGIPNDYFGSQIAAVMKYGIWVVDQHFDVQWFARQHNAQTERVKARRTYGIGFSVMNPFASYIETTIPEATGKRISLTYGTFNLFTGWELGTKGFGKGTFFEPRVMLIPRMPAYSVADENKLRVMTGVRIYKEIDLKKRKNK